MGDETKADGRYIPTEEDKRSEIRQRILGAKGETVLTSEELAENEVARQGLSGAMRCPECHGLTSPWSWQPNLVRHIREAHPIKFAELVARGREIMNAAAAEPSGDGLGVDDQGKHVSTQSAWRPLRQHAADGPLDFSAGAKEKGTSDRRPGFGELNEDYDRIGMHVHAEPSYSGYGFVDSTGQRWKFCREEGSFSLQSLGVGLGAIESRVDRLDAINEIDEERRKLLMEVVDLVEIQSDRLDKLTSRVDVSGGMEFRMDRLERCRLWKADERDGNLPGKYSDYAPRPEPAPSIWSSWRGVLMITAASAGGVLIGHGVAALAALAVGLW